MTQTKPLKAIGILAICLVVTGCGRGVDLGLPGVRATDESPSRRNDETERRETIWDLFGDRDDPNVTVEVNKYIWNAALDVLSFLPVEAADPFSGVIVTGYGRPPGGGRAYRATVYVQDPALDARSLTVALHTQSGPASAATVRAIEDAILTRARQLRVQDTKL